MINRLPWRKKLRTSAANNLDKINEIIDYINHSDISPVALSESGSGRSVPVGTSSSLKSLTIHGESIQDGTPTPDAPVEVQTVETPDGGQFGILIGDTVTPIDLQGNVLASLPDGTHDRLLVDSAGHVTLEKYVDVVTLDGSENMVMASENAVAVLNSNPKIRALKKNLSTANNSMVSNRFVQDQRTLANFANGGIKISDTLYFKVDGITTTTNAATWLQANETFFVAALITPQTIDLGYIDMPAIESGDAISVSASIVPVIDATWWERGAGAVADAIKAIMAALEARTGELAEAIADITNG